MPLWLVKRRQPENTNYGQYRAFVIRAKNEEEALAIAATKRESYEWIADDIGIIVERLSDSGKSEIILGDYQDG